MKNIKTALLLFTQLTFTIISFANCNCFEKNISKIGNQINYLQIAIENGIEEKFCFQIKDNQVVLDTLGKVGISKILKPSVEDIDWKILLETCETSNLPKSFCIEFKLDKIDSIYVTNQILTIQKQSTKYIMNPSKEEHHFYSNSKLAIKKTMELEHQF